MTIRIEDFQKIEDVQTLLDGWRTEAANVGVDLRYVTVNFPAVLNGIVHGVQFMYDDSGIEDTNPFWQIATG